MFAENGFRVYAASRHPGQSQSLPGGGAIMPVKLDVTDEASIKSVVDLIIAKEGEISIVMHCAVMHIAGPAEDTPADFVRRQLETNYLGPMAVNRHVLPHMRQKGRGLVLAVSSIGGVVPLPFQSQYCSGKYAVEAYARALRMETLPFGIRVCIVQPGDTKTNVTDSRHIVIPENSPYAPMFQSAIRQIEHDERTGKSPVTVAAVVKRIAQKKNPPVTVTVGADYKFLVLLRRLLPERLVLFVMRKMYIKGR